MVQEELQELELSVCEGHLLALMTTDHPLETCQIAPHTIKNPPLELEEIGVDAHPVAGIFAVRGFQVLSLERA
jgi:hypothetical protein